MCRGRHCVLVVALFAIVGCGKETTAQLLDKLKAPDALTRLKAVRSLPQRKEDAAQIVPALIEALKDEDAEVRKGAAFGLWAFGEEARSATPALLVALRDREASVRKAAAGALKKVDPAAATRARVR